MNEEIEQSTGVGNSVEIDQVILDYLQSETNKLRHDIDQAREAYVGLQGKPVDFDLDMEEIEIEGNLGKRIINNKPDNSDAASDIKYLEEAIGLIRQIERIRILEHRHQIDERRIAKIKEMIKELKSNSGAKEMPAL
ncbi:MAG: hypothetical protein NTW50_03160 [Candidatus Berkelbacteria bacterium]|nr:hypothetical protein [Candidatus Berkelbacteria bacterium]